MQKISHEEILRRMMDPDVPDSDIRPYVRLDTLESGDFRPVVKLNPDVVEMPVTEAAMALASLNGISRWRRQQRYARKIVGWTGLRVVAEGDSWFQYPFLLDDVIDQLFDRWAIYCTSAAGDLLSDMARQDEIAAAVRTQKPDLLLLSGGGNDLLGGGSLQRHLKPFQSGGSAEEHIADSFAQLLDSMLAIYARLIDKALVAGAPRVICHCYDHAIPARGRWLGRPMEALGIVEPALQREIILIMIDRFYARLVKMAENFPGRVTVVDTRGSVSPGQWHDELHPTNRGFAVVSALIRAAGENTELPVPAPVESTAPETPLPVNDPVALEALLAAAETDLLQEIGRRQLMLEAAPDAAAMVQLEMPAMATEAIWGDLSALGSRVLKRFERELHDLICGKAEGVAKEREQLAAALRLDRASIVAAVTASLIQLSCPALVAPLVATLIVRKGLAPVVEELCDAWQERLGPSLEAGLESMELEQVSLNDDAHVDLEDAQQPDMSIESVQECRVGPWRLALSLESMRVQVNARAPDRNRSHDGTIGDCKHMKRNSDHNPQIWDGGKGVVTAIDITHDPVHGCDANALANSFAVGRDPRIKYVIWNHRIMSATNSPWTWRPYRGANPHTAHIHVSVSSSKRAYDDNSPWAI